MQTNLIRSIAEHTKSHQYSILVTQKPGNCHRNFNRLWRRCTAPYVVVMDEDVEILQDGWLQSLIDALERDPQLGVVGAQDIKKPDLIQNVREPQDVDLRYVTWIPAFVMAFKLSRVPFLRADEAIPGDMGMTDLDLCCQLQSQGLRVAVNRSVVVYHPARDDDETRKLEQRPFVSQQEAWFPLQTAYMREKWGDQFARMIGK